MSQTFVIQEDLNTYKFNQINYHFHLIGYYCNEGRVADTYLVFVSHGRWSQQATTPTRKHRRLQATQFTNHSLTLHNPYITRIKWLTWSDYINLIDKQTEKSKRLRLLVYLEYYLLFFWTLRRWTVYWTANIYDMHTWLAKSTRTCQKIHSSWRPFVRRRLISL